MPFGNGTGPFGQGQRGGRGKFGRSRGRGRMYQGQSPFTGQPSQDFTPPVSKQQELEALKTTSQQLKQQLDIVLERIEQLEGRDKRESQKFKNLKAFIDESKCTACGICANVCPQSAIMVNDIARVNAALCTGCGECVRACSNKAIFLRKV